MRRDCMCRLMTCVNGDLEPMPWALAWDAEMTVCGAPAVDFFVTVDQNHDWITIWLCAEHWDWLEAL